MDNVLRAGGSHYYLGCLLWLTAAAKMRFLDVLALNVEATQNCLRIELAVSGDSWGTRSNQGETGSAKDSKIKRGGTGLSLGKIMKI
jgi:hypothetical protein